MCSDKEKEEPTYGICDYSDTDYAEFWKNHNREYEDAVERIALRRLVANMNGTCLEIGGGYGRLINEYAHQCSYVLLTDYAESLIRQARIRVQELGLENVDCMTANLYELDVCVNKFHNAVCVRVMHHVENVAAFFEQVNSILRDDGIFIFEYANKKNLMEILRYLFRRPNIGPFDYLPSKRGAGIYYNFHPDYVKDMLEQSGFVIEEELTVSIFRNAFAKKLFGYKLLAKLERLLQKPLSRFHPGPSVFVKARKVNTVSRTKSK